MLDTPEIVETDTQDAAVIRLHVPRSDMMKVFGPAVGEVMAALAAQDIRPAGPVFAHHLRMSRDMFDFELGVPVAVAVAPVGRVKPGRLPAVKAARAVYRGPYEGLPAAWGAFDTWMKANGCEPADDLWEVYQVGPQSGLAPDHWRTELNRPLAAG